MKHALTRENTCSDQHIANPVPDYLYINNKCLSKISYHAYASKPCVCALFRPNCAHTQQPAYHNKPHAQPCLQRQNFMP